MKAIAIFSNHIRGSIEFEQSDPKSPLIITFNLSGFKPFSVHAIHIHEFGDFSEGCKSLGSHFNPTNERHSHSEMGHAGDLINNFTTNRFGQFFYRYSTFRLSLTGPLSVLGRSVVIHKFPDDLGLQGITMGSSFLPYEALTTDELKYITKTLGYHDIPHDRNSMLSKLKKESITTGNASTRIAGAIIGLKSS